MRSPEAGDYTAEEDGVVERGKGQKMVGGEREGSEAVERVSPLFILSLTRFLFNWEGYFT
jgi:hypothetical protein